MTWLIFALGTVLFWGIYGVLLHKGQMGMADPAAGRYKAFLLVGIAYFVVAVLAPLIVLWAQGKSGAFWNYPIKGIGWSFIAGVAGAIGAFGVLLALGAAVKAGAGPAPVMSIVFAGAPIVNALVAMAWHPPATKTPPLFYAGIAFAALGGFLVAKYNPTAQVAPKPPLQKAGD
jgi:hypothetical protein